MTKTRLISDYYKGKDECIISGCHKKRCNGSLFCKDHWKARRKENSYKYKMDDDL